MGEVLARAAETSEAEENFLQALSVARNQGARMWELRAAISLARLWAGRGKQLQAYSLLGSIYDCFAGGADTVDQREAAALLDQLSQACRPITLNDKA
jgi:predicted ATPase